MNVIMFSHHLCRQSESHDTNTRSTVFSQTSWFFINMNCNYRAGLKGVNLHLKLSETSFIKRHHQFFINITQQSKKLIMTQFEEEILVNWTQVLVKSKEKKIQHAKVSLWLQELKLSSSSLIRQIHATLSCEDEDCMTDQAW